MWSNNVRSGLGSSLKDGDQLYEGLFSADKRSGLGTLTQRAPVDVDMGAGDDGSMGLSEKGGSASVGGGSQAGVSVTDGGEEHQAETDMAGDRLVYDGTWVNDLFEGNDCTYNYDNGDVYKGSFAAGKSKSNSESKSKFRGLLLYTCDV